MGYTVFYNNLNENSAKIGWRDIFSEFRKKHDKQDLEYALAAGTSLNTASEEYMLQKWRKPWVFYPLLKWGIILIALLYVLYFALGLSGHLAGPLGYMVVIIPPLIPPLIMLIFFWEINIPRNLSVYELFGMWLLGGIISFAVVSLLFYIIPESLPAWLGAPLREEPAKLVASLIILGAFSRKKRIYGITGFVIGAAVGAGFDAFETVDYVLRTASAGELFLKTQVLRNLTSVGGHVLYCAPYMAEIARHVKSDNRLIFKCIFNIDVLSAFFVSCLLHGLWDSGLGIIIVGVLGKLIGGETGTVLGLKIGEYFHYIVLIVLIWLQGIRILRKSLNQVVQIGAVASGGAALMHGAAIDDRPGDNVTHVQRPSAISEEPAGAVQNDSSQALTGAIRVTCNAGELKGQSWQSAGDTTLIVGRGEDCALRFSTGAKGVSGRHCSIQMTQYGWTVSDLGSSYGTFVSGNQKVLPGTHVKLKTGDIISLGGNDNTLIVEIFAK